MPIFRYRMLQWVLEVRTSDQGEFLESYRIYNPGGDGEERFYAVAPGKYGEPLIEAEPTLSFDCPVGLTYVDRQGNSVMPDQKISGVICRDGLRSSLTNARNKGISITVNEDGSIQVDEEVWWISTLFLKDRNRISGYDAFMIRGQPETVSILELGDLIYLV